jgi:uncharacterized protein YjiK
MRYPVLPLRRVAAGITAAALAALSVALIAPAAHATPSVAAPAVDLSSYSLVARYSLPEPTNTTPPDSTSLLAQEASSVTYDWDLGTLFVVGDGGTSVVQVDTTGKLLDSMTLAKGSSPQGTEFYDTEAITYVGNGQFVLGEERYQQVNLFTYHAGTTLTRAEVKTVKLGATIGNIGIEGVSYDPSATSGSQIGLLGVKETEPKGIFTEGVDFAAGTATNANPSGEPANLFDPTLVATADFSDIYAMSNQPSLTDPALSSQMLIISQQSGMIVDVDRSGNTLSSMDIVDSGAPLSVPDETHEGITMDRAGNIYTVNENGGGDASHPQLWVYSKTTPATPRVAVTEVAPWGSSAPYAADWFELTNTGSTDIDLTGWTMDDSSDAVATSVPLHGLTTLPAGRSAIFFEDDPADQATSDAAIRSGFSRAWFGGSTPPSGLLVGYYGGSGVGLGTSGDAVNLFDGTGSHVTGVSFGAATTNVTFDNSARLGSTTAPVAISTLAVAGINAAGTAPDGEIGSPDGLTPSSTPVSAPKVVISEVAPWGSSSSYAADWFELTNVGTTAVDLTDWKMDDSSATFATAVPLTGVTTLPAGASAVFLEDTSGTDSAIDTAFAQAWLGKNAFPTGDFVGHYGGSGVGLSTGGDGVTLFDGGGNVVTGVTFGAATTNLTFDNSAGLGSATAPYPVITTLSAVGTNGAFLGADALETGSPFRGPASSASSAVVISEVAPWASGNAAYAADWFELTNKSATDIDLTGWKMDDSSDVFTSAVSLHGVSTLPAGRSAVFLEDTSGTDATIQAGFAQAWFGTPTLPSGFLIGFYGGSGVGLSTGGDSVAVFDANGNRVTGVSFGSSPSTSPYGTFDNTAGVGSTDLPLPTIATLSTTGTDGAFVASDAVEVGSPGNVVDATKPVITAQATPAPNAAGWNNTAVTVSYTCTDDGLGVDTAASDLASDVLAASGTATGTCVDRAGNSATASYTAQIDTTAPAASAITVTGPSGTVATGSVSFTFGSADTDVTSYLCKLDTVDTAFADCTSGYAKTGLADAAYTLEVQAVDRAGNVSAPASHAFTVDTTPGPKAFTAAPVPTITGSAKVGATLAAHAGSWAPVDGGIALAYRWSADGVAIKGATGSTLVVTPALARHRITVTVIGSQSGYAATAKTSAATAAVALGTLSAQAPTVTGKAKVGKRLVAHAGVWSPVGVTLTYRWYAHGKAIKGASQSTLKLTGKLVKRLKGRKITVQVTGTAPGYAALVETSRATTLHR